MILCRAIALVAVGASAALAQTASIVDILADDSQVLVGRTLQMRAVVRDAAGNAIANAPVTWSVNQAGAATISSTGLVTAKGLATVRIAARSGTATGEAAIQTIPSRVEITPQAATIDVGTQMKFQAAAYDADGNVIPGVTFSWSLTNQRQGSSSIGRIDNTGLLTSTGEGGLWVWATYTYNENFPGLQTRWAVYAPVQAAVSKSYQLHKIYSTLSQTRRHWTLRARQSMIWSTDDGQLFFNASLGGLANGLLNWKNGEFTVVSGGGVPRFGRGSTALEFRQHSITREGKVLSYEDTNINGTELNLGDRAGLTPFLNNNVPLGSTEATSGLFITRNSYTSTGWTLVRSNFRFPGDTANTFAGIFRGVNAANEMLVSTADKLPEFSAAFSIDSDFGIAGDGTAFYSLTSGATRNFYRHGGDGRQKLIGTGDAVLGSKVRSFLGGGTNYQATWFDDDGTAVVGVLLEDNSQHYLSFAPDGAMTSLRLTSQSGILFRHPAQGLLVFANPYNNKGNGAYLWQGNDLKPVYVFGKKLFDNTIQTLESGTVNKQGEVTLILRGDVNALLVARMSDNPTLLWKAGDEITADLPVNLFTLIGGARTGPPHAQVGGNNGSIAELAGGDWNLTLGIGERLFGNTMWYGGSHGSTYNMRKAPNGDIYFINGAGIARITPGGAPQTVIAFPLRIDAGLTLNVPSQLDVNSNGAVLFHGSTSAGDNRMFLYQDGKATQLLVLSATAATASVLDGRTVQSFDSFGLDDTGRVIAQLRFRGVTLPSLGVWDGSKWTMAAIPGQTRIGSQLITNLPNLPRAAGSKLLAGLTNSGGQIIIAEWLSDAWSPVLNIDTVMPNGQVANSISTLDVNVRGDVLFQYANGVNSMVLRRGNKLYQVHDLFRPTGDGDFLIRINAMDLRDDGTVYFLAVTQDDEVVLYRADPLF